MNFSSTPLDQIQTADLAVEFARRKVARERLLEFAQYVNPSYDPQPVHEYIAERLERIESGDLRRLAIFVPPAIGKSELVSRIFPAWVVGRNPDRKIIETSYNEDLAKGFGRNVRDTMLSPEFVRLFPDCKLDEKAQAADAWATTARGTYKAEGVGGGLIGFHGHIAIIDDPYAGPAEGESPTRQKTIWDWYTGTLVNRLLAYHDGPGAIILIMQRWHDEDLGGKCLEHEDWEVVKIPSIAEENDPLGRDVGSALWPERRSLQELRAIRKANPRMFMATHQQEPVATSGEIFESAWFREWRNLPPNLTYYGASDYAVSQNAGDYTVHVVAGVDDSANLYVVDMWRDRTNSREWIDALVELYRQWEPFMWAEERGQILKGVGPFLELRMREEGLYTIRKPFTSTGNKELRARSIAGMAQSGRVYLPHEAPWLGDFLHECVRFPNGKHDDMVDAMALLGKLLTSMRTVAKPPSRAAEVVDEERNPTFNEMLERRRARRRGIRMTPTTYAR